MSTMRDLASIQSLMATYLFCAECMLQRKNGNKTAIGLLKGQAVMQVNGTSFCEEHGLAAYESHP